MRTSTAGVPKTVSRATATMTTASEGPRAEMAPARKLVFSSVPVMPMAGAAIRAAFR